MQNSYNWEIELKDKSIITSGKVESKDLVIRISYIPKISLYPRHDIFFDKVKFVNRFSRNFMNWVGKTKECVHCVVTSDFRIYIFSFSGNTMITPVNYELYL